MSNLVPSDRAALVGVIDPDAYAPGEQSTGWIDASKFDKFMAVVFAGDMGTATTIAAKIEQATDASAGGKKDVTGKAITNFTKAGTDDNKQAIINLSSDELDVNGGFKFFRLTITFADTTSPRSATSDGGGVVFGFDPRFAPASDNDATTVDEIVY
jgi:hypothetical protein